MGLYSMMRTSTSGMAAQANRLGTVADNIANSDTTGYKRASVQFSTLMLESGTGEYVSGSVETMVKHGVSEQGGFKFTTSTTDLAVKGNGFFLVEGPGGETYLTRAGSFVKDGDGNLINAGGFKLLGYPLDGTNTNAVANGTAGLAVVNVGAFALQANPSTEGHLYLNLPFNSAAVAAADLPSANAATAQYTGKTSLVGYDNVGNEVTLDIYSTKTAADTWEIAVYNRATAAVGGGFPYTSPALATQTLNFSNGQLTAASPKSISLTIPNGAAFDLDLSQTSQLATDYTVLSTAVNGNSPSQVDRVEIGDDGTLSAIFENGTRLPSFRIPLADVPSSDNMTPLAGNVFAPNQESGDIQVGYANTAGFGTLVSGALEQSTVDLASELTAMIESERNYTANSKVFQTGAELMDVLVNLKR